MGARMIKIFNKYLIKRSFYFSLSILLIFGLLDSIFILISELEKSSSNYTVYHILKYITFSMPHSLLDFIQGACLLGVMLSLGISHEEGNINVLRSAGKSPLMIVFTSSIGALILILSMLSLDEFGFRKLYVNQEAERNILLNKELNYGNEINWIKSGDSFLGFENVVDDKIFNVSFVKVKDKKVIYSVKSDVATFGNNEVIFNNGSIYKSFTENLDKKDTESFEIPIQSKITFNNIKHLGISELNFYRQILNDSTTKKDILFKAHIDKFFYSKILLPISSLILILFFGSFIFTSLRDSSIGNRVVVSVVGAFIYQLVQDLSSDVFISYGLTIMFGVILPSLMLLVASMVSYKRI